MQISCGQCATTYTLDERLIPPGGAPVQCTRCGLVFTAHRPTERRDTRETREPEKRDSTQIFGRPAGFPAPTESPVAQGSGPKITAAVPDAGGYAPPRTQIFGRPAASPPVPVPAPLPDERPAKTQAFGRTTSSPQQPIASSTQVYGRAPSSPQHPAAIGTPPPRTTSSSQIASTTQVYGRIPSSPQNPAVRPPEPGADSTSAPAPTTQMFGRPTASRGPALGAEPVGSAPAATDVYGRPAIGADSASAPAPTTQMFGRPAIAAPPPGARAPSSTPSPASTPAFGGSGSAGTPGLGASLFDDLLAGDTASAAAPAAQKSGRPAGGRSPSSSQIPTTTQVFGRPAVFGGGGGGDSVTSPVPDTNPDGSAAPAQGLGADSVGAPAPTTQMFGRAPHALQDPTETQFFGRPVGSGTDQASPGPALAGRPGLGADSVGAPAPTTQMFGRPAIGAPPPGGRAPSSAQDPASTQVFGRPLNLESAGVSGFNDPAGADSVSAPAPTTQMFGRAPGASQDPATTQMFGRAPGASQDPATTQMFGRPVGFGTDAAAPGLGADSVGAPAPTTQMFGRAPGAAAQNPASTQVFGRPTGLVEDLMTASVDPARRPPLSADSVGAPAPTTQMFGRAPGASQDPAATQMFGRPIGFGTDAAAPGADPTGRPGLGADSVGAPAPTTQMFGRPAIAAQPPGGRAPSSAQNPASTQVFGRPLNLEPAGADSVSAPAPTTQMFGRAPSSSQNPATTQMFGRPQALGAEPVGSPPPATDLYGHPAPLGAGSPARPTPGASPRSTQMFGLAPTEDPSIATTQALDADAVADIIQQATDDADANAAVMEEYQGNAAYSDDDDAEPSGPSFTVDTDDDETDIGNPNARETAPGGLSTVPLDEEDTALGPPPELFQPAGPATTSRTKLPRTATGASPAAAPRTSTGSTPRAATGSAPIARTATAPGHIHPSPTGGSTQLFGIPDEAGLEQLRAAHGAAISLPPEPISAASPLGAFAESEDAEVLLGNQLRRRNRTALLVLVGVIALAFAGFFGSKIVAARHPVVSPQTRAAIDEAVSLLRRDDLATRERALEQLERLSKAPAAPLEIQGHLVTALALQLDDARIGIKRLELDAEVLNRRIARLQEERSPSDWQNRVNAMMDQLQNLKRESEPLAEKASAVDTRLLALLQALPQDAGAVSELPPRDAVAVVRGQAVAAGVKGTDQAITLAERYRALTTEQTDGWDAVALAEYALNARVAPDTLADARTQLDAVIAKDATFLRPYVLAARVSMLQRRFDQAASALEATVALNPSHEVALKLLRAAHEAERAEAGRNP